MSAAPQERAPYPGPIALTVRVGMEGEKSPSIRLVVADAAILGRADDEGGFRPDLDLEPFGALDAGVSRRHAQIAYRQGAMFLSDLGSVNGTRINGFALEPDQACRLRDGDRIELGHLMLRIHFHEA
ncbi:MAG: FHA domain-containing protein [Anaerolineae bacterium]|nr:FHA domain-containing protein [Anaerolineae bacterium]